jgi:excisionase family DNA binding protein
MTNTREQLECGALVEARAWLSYAEAQRFSGLGRTKLWELISTGEVVAAKVGRAVRISKRSLNEHMRRNRYVEARG